MKNMRKALLAAATATAVTLSGTAVANATEDLPGSNSSSSSESSSGSSATAGAQTDDDEGKDKGNGASGSSDFGEVFGSFVTDETTGDTTFQFAQALKAMKNVAAFGTAVAGVLGVIVTLSTKIPEVLEIFGIDTPSKK